MGRYRMRSLTFCAATSSAPSPSIARSCARPRRGDADRAAAPDGGAHPGAAAPRLQAMTADELLEAEAAVDGKVTA